MTLGFLGSVLHIRVFYKKSYCLPFFQKCLLLSILSQMPEGVWTSSYCLGVEGFPKLLYATMQKLEIKDRPKYEGREYEDHETERCEVTVYIGKSEDFPDIAEA
jgi:hypothetical protein